MSQATNGVKASSKARIMVVAVVCVLLAALSVEIIYRRLVVGQIPTLFSGYLVYGLIAVNTGYIFWAVRRFRQRPS